jgi:hypothetical protein
MNSAETKLQISIMRWWALEYRELGCPNRDLLFHVPNGGQRSKRSAAIFKAMGVRAGIPDLLLAYPRHGYHLLALELKAGRGKMSEAQRDMRGVLIAEANWWVEEVRDIEQAINLFRHYFSDTSEYFAHG